MDNGADEMNSAARPLQTVGNPHARFHGLRDSMRIHHVLLRFSTISLLSAAVDNLIFYFVFRATRSIAEAQIVARTISVGFNYFLVHRAVFISEQHHKIALPRYLLVVAVNAALSYAGIRVLTAYTPLNVFASKITAETLLFAANFAVQRAFVFKHRTQPAL